MIVKLTQNLNNGLAPWKEMVHNNAHKMKEHGFRAIFAGTEAGDDSKIRRDLPTRFVRLGDISANLGAPAHRWNGGEQ